MRSSLWEAALRVGMAGMNPMSYLDERDPLSRMMRLRLAESILDRQDTRDQSTANRIANSIWGSFRMRRSG